MTPDEVRRVPLKVLTSEQREFYYENGYLHVTGLIPSDWLTKLRGALENIIEQSRALTETNNNFVLDPAHKKDAPRLRRLNYAADNHPVFWDYVRTSPLPDAVADLIGPDIKFRESMLNFKWARGGDEVKWHQDTSYPYTNTWPIQTLTCLEDVGPDQGPLMVMPGSHKGEVFNRYDKDGRWIGTITDEDLRRVRLEQAVALTGPAGSVTFLHIYTIHGSHRNDSPRGRPLLLCGYDPADAFPIRGLPMVSRYTGEIIRGKESQYAHVEAGKVQLPPDWTKQRYTSIYEIQQKEQRKAGYYGS
jgi:ectoine hydroxylase-related dioxygenase (phytanoyl-CoA dioxygenase family)